MSVAISTLVNVTVLGNCTFIPPNHRRSKIPPSIHLASLALNSAHQNQPTHGDSSRAHVSLFFIFPHQPSPALPLFFLRMETSIKHIVLPWAEKLVVFGIVTVRRCHGNERSSRRSRVALMGTVRIVESSRIMRRNGLRRSSGVCITPWRCGSFRQGIAA
jgi:hypothetical protein